MITQQAKVIGSFIKQKGTSLTGFVTREGAIKAGKATIPAYVAVTGHGCECVIPASEVEIISPPEEKKAEDDFSGILSNWGTPERVEKILTLFDGVWDEYDRLSQEEKDKLPMWLGKALAEMLKGW